MRHFDVKSDRAKRASAVVAALLASGMSALPAYAQDATWLANPGSNDLNTAGNWSPAAVPTGTAFFGASNTTNIAITAATALSGWTFNTGASAYTITNNDVLTFTGAGIVLNGGSVDIVNNNSLVFSNGSSAGNATITTAIGGTTSFIDTATGGTARFIVDTGGTLDISAATAGVAAGSIEGSGNIQLGANTLTVGGNNLSTIFSGFMQDGGNAGILIKEGTGTLTLSGNNTYSGDTNVNGGTLLVTGSIVSSPLVFVGPGATLGGTGLVASVFLDDGATLAPGTPTSIGTLTVDGLINFCACSIYAVKVSATGSDSTDVIINGGLGYANLDGAVRVTSPTGTFRFNTPYTILTTAAGVNGTFNSLSLPTGISGQLIYNANDVQLSLTSSLRQVSGLGQNQQRIATLLDTAFNAGSGTGAMAGIYNGDVNANLAQLSGQPATGIAPAGLQMTAAFLSTMLHPNGGATGGNPATGGTMGYAAERAPSSEAAAAYAAVTPKDRRVAYAPPEPRWSVWGQFYGGHRSADGDASTGASGTMTRAYGVATGFEYRPAPDWVVGLALAGGATKYSVADGLGGGKSDVFQLGVYGTKKFGAAYLSAALSYAWHDASTDRTVTLTGIDRLVADFSAHSFGGRLEGGYRVDAAMFSVTPYAAVQVQAFRTSAYSESATLGSNAFALSYDARTVNATRTELGAWFDKTVMLERGAIVTWHGRLAWAHDFNNDQNVNAVFQSLPGASFTVSGARTAPNAALLSAGAELRLVNNWSVAAKFDGEFASGAQTYTGTGTLRYVW